MTNCLEKYMEKCCEIRISKRCFQKVWVEKCFVMMGEAIKMERYERVPLSVEVIFDTEGNMTPCRIRYGETSFAIDRVLRVGKYCPPMIRAVSPIEYTIVVEGIRKHLYFEPYSKTWFAVREQNHLPFKRDRREDKVNGGTDHFSQRS